MTKKICLNSKKLTTKTIKSILKVLVKMKIKSNLKVLELNKYIVTPRAHFNRSKIKLVNKIPLTKKKKTSLQKSLISEQILLPSSIEMYLTRLVKIGKFQFNPHQLMTFLPQKIIFRNDFNPFATKLYIKYFIFVI